MRRFLVLVVVVVLCTVPWVTGQAAAETPTVPTCSAVWVPVCVQVPGVLEQRAQTYAKVNTAAIKLDAYTADASGAAPAPAIVMVHGGGWIRGSRADWAERARKLVLETGWAAFSVDYDMTTLDGDVTETKNVRAAVAWIRAHASGFKIDPTRIALVGESAGAHLAMLAGTTTPGPLTSGDRVKAVVSLAGISDMALLAQTLGCADTPCDPSPSSPQYLAALASKLMHGTTLATDPARWAAASPVSNVDPSDPPMLLVHSSSDPVVPMNQLGVMQSGLVANGVEVTATVVPGTTHAFDGNSKVWNQMVQFLRDHV